METTTENGNHEVSDFQKFLRARSSRRLRHEAQVQVFTRQNGELEGIRRQLGLRPSQICELLKVHPSAWTRWTKAGNQAPPHIYQMLEWYLELLKWRGQTTALQDPKVFVPANEPEKEGKDPSKTHQISQYLHSNLSPEYQLMNQPLGTKWMPRLLVATWIFQLGLIAGLTFWLRTLR